MLVKAYLECRNVERFKENMPGQDWLESFLNHCDTIRIRMCQNISRKRASVSRVLITCYFNNLQDTLKEIPPENIVNYDETNLSDDPGRKKVVVKRGIRILKG